MSRHGIVHVIHHPVSARSFILPILRFFRDQGMDGELWSEPSAVHQLAREGTDVPMHAICCDLTPHPLVILEGIIRLIGDFRHRRTRLLHAHQTRAALVPLLAATLAGVPIRIYHNHGMRYLAESGWRRRLLRLVERCNIALATHVLMVSPSNYQDAVEDGLIDASQAQVLGPGSITGIDTHRFTPPDADEVIRVRQRFAVNGHGLVIGWVGRPVDHKGFGLLIEGWQRAGLAERGARLLLAGCTDEQLRASRRMIPFGVIALGYLDDMPAFYQACDAVALVSEHEGLPYALLEAAACGCGLIASAVSGNRDAVIAGRTGLLIERTPQAVADAFQQLDGDRALCRRLGLAARERIVSEFTQAGILNLLREYYRHLPGSCHG